MALDMRMGKRWKNRGDTQQQQKNAPHHNWSKLINRNDEFSCKWLPAAGNSWKWHNPKMMWSKDSKCVDRNRLNVVRYWSCQSNGDRSNLSQSKITIFLFLLFRIILETRINGYDYCGETIVIAAGGTEAAIYSTFSFNIRFGWVCRGLSSHQS